MVFIFQICKDHSVETDPVLLSELEDSGYPTKYISSALKLANNNFEIAGQFIQKMMARDVDLRGDSESKDSITAVPFSNSPPKRKTSCSYSDSGRDLHQNPHALLTGRKFDVDPFTGLNTLLTDGDLVDIEDLSEEEQEDDVEDNDIESVSSYGSNLICSICSNDDVLQKDQLVPCAACRLEFHTTCLGRRLVPFSLKTPKERQAREKFISKNYRY